MEESNIKKFNTTMTEFVKDLKNIFGQSDRDLLKMETALEFTKIKVRIIMDVFVDYILNNDDFVRHIFAENLKYFLQYDFVTEIGVTSRENLETIGQIVIKFKKALEIKQDDSDTIKAIFNWFKMLIYYASQDQNKDVSHLIS